MASEKAECCREYSWMPIFMVLFFVALLAVGYLTVTKPSVQNFNVSPAIERNTVSSSGEARMTVLPDVGYITFTITTNRSTAQLAQEENARIVDRIKQILLAEGLESRDIETRYFNVQPIYRTRRDCRPGDSFDCIYTQEFAGYEVTHQIRLKIDNVNRTGEFADLVTARSENEIKIDAINMALQEETRRVLEMQLLNQAAGEARERAARIAEGLRVRLGNPVTVQESVVYPYYYRDRLSAAPAFESASVSTEVFGGEITITANVDASFEITEQ